MGIKYFFSWMKKEFAPYMYTVKKGICVKTVEIDTFLIDLNGLFHASAAKVYGYGEKQKNISLLRKESAPQSRLSREINLACYKDICSTILQLVSVVKPRQKLVLCIDGVAPLSKQNQQRQRRYRGIIEEPDKKCDSKFFDARCITPGTLWMDNLSKFIDWFIRKEISENEAFSHLEVIFSNEKVPGEGEHKLIDYIRKYGSEDETYCINALDADLVMLSLGTHKSNFYLLREENFNPAFDYTYVDIGKGVREHLQHTLLFWEGANDKIIIDDFILICFLCGNDFLPNVPSIQLIDHGMSTIIDLYKQACRISGHLTDGHGNIVFPAFQTFLSLIGASEKNLLFTKWKNRQEYIEDTLLDMCIQDNEEDLNFELYKKSFYEKKGITDVEKAVHLYIDGCQWVLTYYLKGIDNWGYVYPYHYAPFAVDLAFYLSTYKKKTTIENFVQPVSPFLQLLCVLPPQCSYLLPSPLHTILENKKFEHIFPKNGFHINYEGKRKKWEGIVELPMVDLNVISQEYRLLAPAVHPNDKKRNVVGKSFSYRKSEYCEEFTSYFGRFWSFCECKKIIF